MKKIKKLLRAEGVVVYDCTCDNGTSQDDVLKKIVQKCNLHDVDLDVAIHLNSSRNDLTGDGKIGGTEVWMRTADGIKAKVGTKICRKMERIGFTNRGVKTTKNWHFLNHTIAPAILVEVAFVDDKDDVKLYKKCKNEIASAIAGAIIESFE